jgi:hypothetical protein
MNSNSSVQQKSTTIPSTIRSVAVILIFTMLGLAFGYTIGNIGRSSSATSEKTPSTAQVIEQRSVGSKVLNGIAAFGIMILAAHLVLGVHEWGHVLGGQLSGFRFMMLIVGLVRILRQGRSIRIGWNTNMSLMGGVASVLPTTATPNVEQGMMRFVAGGPVASLVLALVAGLPFALKGFVPQWSGIGGLASLFFGATAVMSLMIFCVTAIPSRASNFSSDGARILMLRKNDAAAKRWCALGIVAGAMMADVRPRDLEERYFRDALALTDDTPDNLSAHLLGYQWALDKGNIEAAAQYLDYIIQRLDKYPEAFRPLVAMEAAYFEARHRRNPTAAREWFGKGHKTSFIEPTGRLRIESAVALAEERHEEAETKARQGLRLLAAKSHLTGGEIMERELLHDLLHQAANTPNNPENHHSPTNTSSTSNPPDVHTSDA